MKITVQRDHFGYGFYAFFGEDYDLGTVIGRGTTQEAAVRDLIDNYDWPEE